MTESKPTKGELRAFWYRHPNFGDQLTPALLRTFGVHAVNSEPQVADAIGVGSILARVPVGFRGAILGSGFLYAHERACVADAKVLALRGAFSLRRAGTAGKPLLGDLGLLASRLLSTSGHHSEALLLGLVPHYVDARHPLVERLRTEDRVCVIDVLRPPELVVGEIARCSHVVSSSLHGLVVANSLGLPSRWIVLSDAVLGGGFKFADFYSAFGMKASALRPSPHTTVEMLVRSCEKPFAGVAARATSLTACLEDYIAERIR